MALICLAVVPAGAEVSAQLQETEATGFSLAQDAALETKVRTRLRRVLPGEAIEVYTANAGLVLSGQVTAAESLHQALAIAQAHAPGRVSNLMTLGQTPNVTLTVSLAEMSPAVARNLSASLTMTGFFSPGAGGSADAAPATGQMAMPALIAALEAKGVLHVRASPTLTFAPGQEAKPVTGAGCNAEGSGVDTSRPGLDLMSTRTEDGRISVAVRTCGAGPPGAGPVPDPGVTVTVLLHDGQTIAVENLFPSVRATETVVEGHTTTVLLITAGTGRPARALSDDRADASDRIATDAGLLLISDAAPMYPRR